MKADEVRERLKFRAEIDALRADKIPAPAPAVPSPTLHVFFPERDGIGRMSAHSWRWRASEWGFAGLGRELGEFDLGSEHPRQSALLPLENAGEILPPTPPHAPKPKTAPRAIVPPPNVNIPLGAALDLTQISASPSHNEARKKANESRFFEPLGEGAYRVTFRIIGSELVVKVATSKNGEKANLDEANRYLGFTDAQKDCVAPVLANDPNGKFVIMPLCKNANNGANRDLRARMEAANLLIADINGHNCGELNGKQVIYDFGLFVR